MTFGKMKKTLSAEKEILEALEMRDYTLPQLKDKLPHLHSRLAQLITAMRAENRLHTCDRLLIHGTQQTHAVYRIGEAPKDELIRRVVRTKFEPMHVPTQTWFSQLELCKMEPMETEDSQDYCAISP